MEDVEPASFPLRRAFGDLLLTGQLFQLLMNSNRFLVNVDWRWCLIYNNF